MIVTIPGAAARMCIDIQDRVLGKISFPQNYLQEQVRKSLKCPARTYRREKNKHTRRKVVKREHFQTIWP